MKKSQILCLLALMATACGGASAGTAVQGSPSASISPSAFSSTPTPSRSPVATPKTSPSPVISSTATLRCRLPISATANANEPPGGWITFPGGKFVRDPASLRNRSGSHLPSYDRAIGAWVPVEYENVSPDGSSYVLYHDADNHSSERPLPRGCKDGQPTADANCPDVHRVGARPRLRERGGLPGCPWLGDGTTCAWPLVNGSKNRNHQAGQPRSRLVQGCRRRCVVHRTLDEWGRFLQGLPARPAYWSGRYLVRNQNGHPAAVPDRRRWLDGHHGGVAPTA